MESRDSQIDSIIAHNKIVDNQIAHISSTLQARQQRALLSQPTRPIDQDFAITLRSGSHFDGPLMPREDEHVSMKNANLGSVIPNNVANNLKGSRVVLIFLIIHCRVQHQGMLQLRMRIAEFKSICQTSIPNRHLKTNLDKQFAKFPEMVKNLQVTVPFAELITQIPVYDKFMKEILTKKSNMMIDNALYDLGARFSVMPLSVCSKLNMGEINRWKEEVGAVGRALYIEGLGFEDEKEEKSEQIAKSELIVRVPMNRVAIAQ
ncbi:uncharacterized protein LOC110728718 [Chenopodium quinoa]|uniref:uncharacterized protein LOC110728718 n=1 Tax=Chenopodium quinoa TaxID=63459 RepID=UPI000B782B11|nr:uncharacterized protein LOC110728718 [Chenopodium quinoa]